MCICNLSQSKTAHGQSTYHSMSLNSYIPVHTKTLYHIVSTFNWVMKGSLWVHVPVMTTMHVCMCDKDEIPMSANLKPPDL